MDKIEELKIKFENISSIGWIKKMSNNKGEIGKNLEKLLNINAGDFEIPDFKGIEIKTKKTFSPIPYIKLFNAAPDGKYLFEIHRIRDTYGYLDKEFSNCKIFNAGVYANWKVKIGDYLFSLKVNKEERKIYLNIMNKDYVLVDNNTYWSFEMLEEKLLRKLQTLAVVDVLNKKINGQEYYRYSDIAFYKLNSFDAFIDSIEKGFTRITFKIGVFRNGKKRGETHDHGTGFDIKKEYLKYLYEKII